MTNGAGMLQFSRGFTRLLPSRHTPVVPVALRVATSPPHARTHTLTSPFSANLLLLGLCGRVRMEAVVLPPMTQQVRGGAGVRGG